MRRKDEPPRAQGEAGAVLVELALTLPVMVLMLMLILNLGTVIHEHQVLQNAVREAARFSALPTQRVTEENALATLDQVRDRVVAYCQQENVEIAASDVSVDQDVPIETAGGLTIRASQVRAVYRRPLPFGSIPFVPFEDIELEATAVFRNFY